MSAVPTERLGTAEAAERPPLHNHLGRHGGLDIGMRSAGWTGARSPVITVRAAGRGSGAPDFCCEVMPVREPFCQPTTLTKQTEQQVFGFDERASVVAGLPLREKIALRDFSVYRSNACCARASRLRL